jgi:AcrR family transcriptional regulator
MKSLEQRPVTTSPEETRDRIIAAARSVMSRKGKRGATTREIAEVAGVNEATLFRHFGSKEQLIVDVAQRSCGVSELRNVAHRMSHNIEDDLLELGRTMMANMESARDMICWSLVEEDYDENVLASTTWRPATAIHEVIESYFRNWVAEGTLKGDANRLALTFMGFIFTHVLTQKKLDLKQILGNRDDALRYYIGVFLNGVRSN